MERPVEGLTFKLTLDGKEYDFLNEDTLFDLQLPVAVQMQALLKALRVILEVPQAESILYHATIIMRRYKRLNAGLH